jgi:hypothetical protein
MNDAQTYSMNAAECLSAVERRPRSPVALAVPIPSLFTNGRRAGSAVNADYGTMRF